MPGQRFTPGIISKPPDPAPVRPDDEARYRQQAQEAYDRETGLKRTINRGIEGLLGIPLGLTGLRQQSGQGAFETGTGIGELMQAGLPFAAIMKGKPVYHGTAEAIKRFSNRKPSWSQWYNSMTHFAEEPWYSELYAARDRINKKNLGLPTHESIIPADLQSKNTLDLVKYDEADLRKVREAFYRRKGGTIPENDPNDSLNRIGELIHNDPELLHDAGFDALRYETSGGNAWAVPNRALKRVQTPWGTPLGIPEKKK